MELEEKIMQAIYDSGYEPVVGNHKRGHVDIHELKERLVTLFGVHYNDIAEVLARAKNDHNVKDELKQNRIRYLEYELSTLKSRNWYQRLFNI